MNKKHLFAIMIIVLSVAKTNFTNAQGMAVNATGAAANSSAMLDVSSNGTPSWQGVLVPRMTTTQRTGISSPAQGLLVFDITAGGFYYYNSGWVSLSSPTGSPASGDLTGSYPNPTIANSNATGNDIATALNSATSKTGLGNVVLATSPTLATPILGTIQSGDLGNATNLNATQLLSGTVPAAVMPALTGGDVTSSAGSVSTSIANTTAAGNHIVTALGSATTGTIPAARLGTSAGSATTFLNGTGAFSTPSGGGGGGFTYGGVVGTTLTMTITGTTNVLYTISFGNSVTLPAAITAGQEIIIACTNLTSGSGSFTVNAAGSDKIYNTGLNAVYGAQTNVNPFGTVHLISDGAGHWFVVAIS